MSNNAPSVVPLVRLEISVPINASITSFYLYPGQLQAPMIGNDMCVLFICTVEPLIMELLNVLQCINHLFIKDTSLAPKFTLKKFVSIQNATCVHSCEHSLHLSVATHCINLAVFNKPHLSKYKKF